MTETIRVRVPAGPASLPADLWLPSSRTGLICLPRAGRNDVLIRSDPEVTGLLRKHRYATLCLDLLLPEEAAEDRSSGWFHLNIPLLADRICLVLAWIRHQPGLRKLPLGLMAEGTTAAGAIVAASRHPDEVWAVVSRSGRPDLAGAALTQLQAPTLLLAAATEPHLVDLNRQAAMQLHAMHSLEVLSHRQLATDRMAEEAVDWFDTHLVATASSRRVVQV